MIIFVQKRLKYFRNFSARYLNFHGELFRFHEFIKYTEQPKKFCVVFGIIIFVQPDIDYFLHLGYCTGEGTERAITSKEKINLFRNLWVINHRNWAVMRGTKIGFWLISVFVPVQLIWNVASILSSDRERYEMTSNEQLNIKFNRI